MLSLILSAFADCQPDPDYDGYTYVDGACLTTDLNCNGGCWTWNDHLQNPDIGEKFYNCNNTDQVSYMAVIPSVTTFVYYFDIDGILAGWTSYTSETSPAVCCEGYYTYNVAYGAVFDCDAVEILTDTATPDSSPDKPPACGCTTSPLTLPVLAPLLLLLRRRRSVPLA